MSACANRECHRMAVCTVEIEGPRAPEWVRVCDVHRKELETKMAKQREARKAQVLKMCEGGPTTRKEVWRDLAKASSYVYAIVRELESLGLILGDGEKPEHFVAADGPPTVPQSTRIADLEREVERLSEAVVATRAAEQAALSALETRARERDEAVAQTKEVLVTHRAIVEHLTRLTITPPTMDEAVAEVGRLVDAALREWAEPEEDSHAGIRQSIRDRLADLESDEAAVAVELAAVQARRSEVEDFLDFLGAS